MENPTAMLANVILLTLDTQNKWVSEPRFKTQELIDSLRKNNSIYEYNTDEDGDSIEKFCGFKDEALEEKLKFIEATYQRDMADYERFRAEKIEAQKKNIDLIKNFAEMYATVGKEEQ
jgi:hypothetical protein